MSEDDREVVRRVQNGDSEAFGVLVEKYKRKTFRLAYGVLRDQEESLDVSQEAFVKAFAALARFRQGAPFRPWLLTIVANEARNRRRSAGRTRRAGPQSSPGPSDSRRADPRSSYPRAT